MKKYLIAGVFALASAQAPAYADLNGARADAHAPIGVMGDHTHNSGEVMFSYRFMRMSMSGSRIGSDEVSPETIATSVANPFGMPPTLRVVPLDMTTDMHMFGAMWAPSDRVTLMAMANYLSREMDHVTFQGMMGTNRLGAFTTTSEGFGDTRVSALIRLTQGEHWRAHATLGVSLPTGSIDETDDVLTPMNMRPTLTLPYAMQLGSGTFDPILGLTIAGHHGQIGWGGQATAILRVHENDADYHLGDEFHATAWASYAASDAASFSARLAARTIGDIDGRDARIAAPVQTADPANYGGERVDFAVGANLAGQSGGLRGVRLAAEVAFPIYQDLNGPQMASDWMATIGLQYSFGG